MFADASPRCALVQVSTFGLSMTTLDIRQESTRHSEVMDTITKYLGLGSYMEWDEVRLLRARKGRGGNGAPEMEREVDVVRWEGGL